MHCELCRRPRGHPPLIKPLDGDAQMTSTEQTPRTPLDPLSSGCKRRSLSHFEASVEPRVERRDNRVAGIEPCIDRRLPFAPSTSLSTNRRRRDTRPCAAFPKRWTIAKLHRHRHSGPKLTSWLPNELSCTIFLLCQNQIETFLSRDIIFK